MKSVGDNELLRNEAKLNLNTNGTRGGSISPELLPDSAGCQHIGLEKLQPNLTYFLINMKYRKREVFVLTNLLF